MNARRFLPLRRYRDSEKPPVQGTIDTVSRRLALFLLAALVGLLVIPMPFLKGRVGGALTDLAHLPAAALLSYLVLALLRTRLPASPWVRRLAVGAIVAIGAGALEFVQMKTGRSASVQDAMANALGALAFLLVFKQDELLQTVSSNRRSPLRWGLSLAAAAAVVLAAWNPATEILDHLRQKLSAPLMASFEDDIELRRMRYQDARGERIDVYATHGRSSLRVYLDAGQYPGVSLAWPLADWSAYDALQFDLVVTGNEPLALIVKIEDELCDDRYVDQHHSFVTRAPGKHRVVIPLSEIAALKSGRRMDLSRMRVIQWFVDGLPTARTMHLDNVRLIRGDG